MKNGFMKKLLSSFLSLTMVVTFAPASMGYAANESKKAAVNELNQEELKSWYEEIKKVTEAEEEKASEKLEIARVKAGATKFVTTLLTLLAGGVAAGAGYLYRENLQAQNKILEENNLNLKNEVNKVLEESSNLRKTLENNNVNASVIENLSMNVDAIKEAQKNVGVNVGNNVQVSIISAIIQTLIAVVKGVNFGTGVLLAAINAVTFVLINREAVAWGLGNIWGGTKYHWNEIFNSKPKYTNLAGNFTGNVDNFTGSENALNLSGNADNFTGSGKN